MVTLPLTPMRRFLTLAFLLPSIALAATPEEWITTLNSENAGLEQKARACQRLGEQGTAEAVTALAKLLPDNHLNGYARAALERIGSLDAGPAMLAALSTTSGHEQLGVVQSIGAMQLRSARPFLKKALEGKDEALAQASLLALGRFGFSEDILSQLKHASRERRDAAAAACLLVPNIALCETILQSEVSSVYEVAATRQLLVLTGSVPKIIEALRSDDGEIRKVALLALRERPSEELAEALHQELATTSAAMKPLLVRALGDTANNKTTGILAPMLSEREDVELRKAVLETLGKLGAYESLMGELEDEHCAMVLAASKDTRVDQVAADALSEATDNQERLRLINLLGRRQSPVALPALLSAAAGLAERQAALQAMEPMVGFAEIPSLISWFKEASDGPLQPTAYKALVAASRRAGATQAGPLLFPQFKPEDTWEAKRPWLNILIRLGYEPALKSVPLDSIASIKLLTFWPNTAPNQSLLPHAQDPSLGSATVDVILTLLTKSSEANERLPTLKALHPSIRTLAHKRRYIAALGETVHPEARALLESYADDASVKEEVEAALKSATR